MQEEKKDEGFGNPSKYRIDPLPEWADPTALKLKLFFYIVFILISFPLMTLALSQVPKLLF
jgi:hypothetical protein